MNPLAPTLSSTWKHDFLLALGFALLFAVIVATIGMTLTFTSQPLPLLFPIDAADGTVGLTRLYCTLPK